MSQLSIIIPTLNEEETIQPLLKHLRQTAGLPVPEIIVADGGSRDRTVERARREGARILECETSGRALQLNRGAKAASGDILYFLHADSLPPEGFDRFIRRAVKDRADAGCFRLRFDSDHPLLRFYAWFTRFNLDSFRFGDQSLFVTRFCFERTGGFRETLLVMEDQEMVRRIRRSGFRFQLLEKNIITSARRYRKHGPVRLQIVFTLVWAGYYVGIGQEALVSFYRKMLRKRS